MFILSSHKKKEEKKQKGILMGAVGAGPDSRAKLHAVFVDLKHRMDAGRSSTQAQINASLNAFVAEMHSVYLETK
jgi:hypothetical protein